MPATVKVKIFAARNLPVMDRTSYLTDAFVEVRLGNTMFKTEVIRRTLNPEWNSEWFCFELNEEALLEETLQVRVLDHDTYSSHDAIGRVYFDLTPLLQTEKKRTLAGWFPLYDTMHGIRGEIHLVVRVDLFSDACGQRFSPLGVRFFFGSSIPTGYRVISLIGFVRELVMNDDPEHQWIEKIRTSRASNEARQCLFSQLAGELKIKLSRKVLNLGGNAVIGYCLCFDLEGDTGIVARAIGTAARLQRFYPSGPLRFLLLKKIPEKTNRDTESETSAIGGSDDRTGGTSLTDLSTGNYALTSPKPLSDAEFPFLTISHPPRELVRHFGSVIAAKSVKLLDKNVAETPNSRAAWWLELRMEALTRMYNVGCDALIGYREECIIYEDVCVLSVSATAVILNQLWIHSVEPEFRSRRPSKSSCPRQDSFGGVAGFIQTKYGYEVDPSNSLSASVSLKGGKVDSLHTDPNYDCSVFHIASLGQTPPPNKSRQCRLCRADYVPEIILSTTNFPPGMPTLGRPSFIQVGLSRSKKEGKGESAAREISEILPYIEYDLHYRLLQKLRLRGMNAVFGLAIQLAVGEALVAVLATGTAVYIPALPDARLPKVCSLGEDLHAKDTTVVHNLKDFNQKCREMFGIPKEACESPEGGAQSSSNFVEVGSKDTKVTPSTVEGTLNLALKDFKTNTNDHEEEHTNTYFIDAREPEPEELNSLLSDPLPPPSMLVMTTDYPPNAESFVWLVNTKRERNDSAFSNFSWRRFHTFVKIHTIQSLKPDDVMGSMSFRYAASGGTTGDISLPILHSSTSLDSTIYVSRANNCMAKCLRDCNQLTWFHFRSLMPCAIVSLMYRLTITDDDIVQIFCSGVALSLSTAESSISKSAPSTGFTKSDDQKVSLGNTRRSLFNRPKGLRSSNVIELKAFEQADALKCNFPERSAAKISNKKGKWWKPFFGGSSVRRPEAPNSAKFFDAQSDRSNMNNDSNIHEEEKCIISPSPSLLNREVTHYLGNYNFFFVRETNDLREIGGLRCFIHAAVMEAQSVAAAHTVAFGGNALLSYQITNLLITRPTSRNQAQCLISVCGDMVQSIVT